MREVSMFLIASFLIFQIGPVSTGVVSGQELPATPSSSELRLQEILRNIPAEVERYSSLNGGIVSFSTSVIPSQATSASSQSDKERLRENLRRLPPNTEIKVNLARLRIGGSVQGRLVEVTDEGFTISVKSGLREFSFDQVESVELTESQKAEGLGLGTWALISVGLGAGIIYLLMYATAGRCPPQGCQG